MKKTWVLFILCITLLTSVSALNKDLPIQGQLQDLSGDNINGTISFEVNVYNTESGGSTLFNQTINTTLTSGVFDITLTDINLSFNEDYFIGINPNSTGELSPRINWTQQTYTTISNMGNNNLTEILSSQYNITGCTGTFSAGTFCYDPEHDTFKIFTVNGQVIQVGQEVSSPMKNKESSTVLEGSYVYQSGASGDNLEFKLARADNFSTSSLVGVVTVDCIAETVCPVVFFGFVNDLDTSVFTINDKRYLSADEAGNATITAPDFPNNIVWMDTVVRVNANNGRTFVFPRLDTSNGMTFNTIGVIDDIIQTDYKIRSLDGNSFIGQNVFCVEMNGTSGNTNCHLVLQPGGTGQASVWKRSGVVVPEDMACANENRTDPNCYATSAGYTWDLLDFNTSIADGADWGITGELEVIKDAFIHGTVTATKFVGNTNASNVTIAKINGANITRLQTYIDFTGSSGYSQGGIIVVNSNGSINISAGQGFIRLSASSLVPLYAFNWSVRNNFEITENTTQYIFVNSSGIITSSTDEFTEAENKVILGLATNEDGVIESSFNLGVRLDESIGQAGRFLRRTDSITRDVRKGGLIFGESGTRGVTLSSGILWWGRTEYTITALDTDVSGGFDIYSSNGKEDTAATQWPNTQYDNAGTLTNLGNNKWGVLWFYLEPDDHVVMVYGTEEHVTEAGAETQSVPSVLPNRLSSSGILAGRFIFQESAATASISSSFDTVFTGAGVTSHTEVSDLAWTSSGHTGTASVFAGFDGSGATTEYTESNYVLVNGTRTMVGPLRIQEASQNALIVGADNGATTLTDATNKAARITMPHYNTGEEDIGIFVGASTSTSNVLTFGGGSSIVNAATVLNFATASSSTTIVGTTIMQILESDINIFRDLDVDGNVNVSAGNDVCIASGNCLSTSLVSDQNLNQNSNVTFNNVQTDGDLNMTSGNITTVDCIQFTSGGQICNI